MDGDPLEPGLARWEDHRLDPLTMPDGTALPIAFVMKPSVHAHGYLAALARLRSAVATNDDVDVHLTLFETVAWLSTLAYADELAGDPDVQAVTLARDRIQHHRAIVFYRDVDDYTLLRWQSEKLMPWPKDTGFQGRPKIAVYESRLADTPLLDVFDRLHPKIVGLLA